MTTATPCRSRAAAALVGLLLAAVAIPSGVGAGASGAQDPAALEGDAERGAALFEDYTCYGCHGYTGETGRGPRLNPPRLRQAQFIGYLRNPPNPRQMPPYRQAEVSDQKLADIYAFLESLPSASPDAEDIPVLREILRETR
jgi:mono/diheme cytochrome c family protein